MSGRAKKRPRTKRVKLMTARERDALRDATDRAAIARSAEWLMLGRERIVDDLEGFRLVSILDFFEQNPRSGRIELKHLDDLRKLSQHHQRWIKKISVRDTIDGQVTTIEGVDLMSILQKSGEHLGMWTGGAPVNIQINNLAGVSDADLAARLREVEAEPEKLA